MEVWQEYRFRQSDRRRARENFLEKEMLDSDVHHLEVRSGFFDKLTVLAGGSLAVGVTFISAGYQKNGFQQEIRLHLGGIAVAFGCVLISLFISVLHNMFISRAVQLLSSQLERLYLSAQQNAVYYDRSSWSDEDRQAIVSHIGDLDVEGAEIGAEKARLVRRLNYAGNAAVLFFLLGYATGIAEVIVVIARTNSLGC